MNSFVFNPKIRKFVNVNNVKITLAPMEGVFDSVTRDIFSQIGGYDHFVTEFLRVSIHTLPRAVFYRSSPELKQGGKTSSGTPVFLQLLGSHPELMGLNATRAVELGAPGIDINFGCPAKRVNNHEGGAKLLLNPKKMEEIISSVVKAVGDLVPVTAKVRLGYENKDSCIDIAKAVENGGAQQITIHARTKMEGYKPPAHWEYIAKMKRAISIPTVANGEIWSVADARRCIEVSECEHIALGRPAFANPGLALDIKRSFSNETTDEPSLPWEQLRSHWLPLFVDQTRKTHHDDFALCRTKQWVKMLGQNFTESSELFTTIKRCQTIDSLFDVAPYLQKR